jgi:hypothetical protein
MIVCGLWKLDPKNPSNEETLYILQGPKGKPKTPLTINKWKIVNGSQIRGKVAIPGKPCDEAVITWGARIGPQSFDYFDWVFRVWEAPLVKHDPDAEMVDRIYHQEQQGHKFNREAESRAVLTPEMVLNPKNYGNAYLPPKRK